MFKNHIKVAFRNLRKQRGYTLINVVGLALGLACCIVAILFVRHEVSYDTFHENRTRIYKVASDYATLQFSTVPDPLIPALVEAWPEVVAGTRLWATSVVVQQGTTLFNENITTVDPDFFEVFTFPLRYGTPALDQPQSIILTPEMAEKYFPNQPNPVGETLSLYFNDTFNLFQVTGVTEPLPENSSLFFDFITPFDLRYAMRGDESRTAWINYGVSGLIQVREGVNVAQIEAKVPAFVAAYMRDAFAQVGITDLDPYGFRFLPLADHHLSGGNTGVYGLANGINVTYLYIFSGIAFLVLLIACFNFMNLSIGQMAQRLREIGVRKVMGAQRAQLMRQFWIEALLLSSGALLLALFLTELLLPVFNELTNATLVLKFDKADWLWPAFVALACVVGIGAGSYPALVLSSTSPAAAFKGRLRIGNRHTLRRGLVTAQFVLSTALIISTLLMRDQQAFIQDYDLGFEAEQVVVVPLQLDRRTGERGDKLVQQFKAQLVAYPGVVHVTGTSNAFTYGTSSVMATLEEGTDVLMFVQRVDPDYVPMMDLNVLQGRNFSDAFPRDTARAVIVNATFVKRLGLEAPVGQVLPFEIAGIEEAEIIGVVEDYHFQDLYEQVQPAFLHMHAGYDMHYALVKIRPEQMPQTLAYLEQTWAQLRPNRPFTYQFLDEDIQQQYVTEQRWSKAISYASIIAVLIACLGLLGLTALTVAQRTKEIGIRKVLGSSVTGIVYILSKELLWLIIGAFVIAAPVAYWAIQRWLEQFAYQVPIGPMTFVWAGLIVLITAWGSIGWQAFKAARANPVEALRYE